MSQRITLTEYQDREVHLSPLDQPVFLADTKKRILVTPTIEPGKVILNPQQYVGVARMPSGLTIDLLPKVDLYNVMWMIAEVERLEGVSFDRLDQQVHIRTFDDVLEPIARAFVELVEHLIDRGLYRTYIEQEDNLTAIRGRIDFREDLNRNVVLRHRTFCRFTEYSWDVPENQVIRQVVHMLARWGFSSRLTDRLVSLDRQMDDITRTHLTSSDLSRFHYSRQSDHYRPIHRFCRLFLDGFSLSEGIGGSPFNGFLMDMNKLFESFVAIRLEAAISRRYPHMHLGRQQAYRLFEDHTNAINPDLVLTSREHIALVADTKYKRRVGADGSPSDYYQMITYCTVLGVNQGVLIYPRHELDVSHRLAVRGSDITLYEVSVDLHESREAIELAFARLATFLYETSHPHGQMPLTG